MSKTTKSFKSSARDKPKHSAGGGAARKDGAGGAGAIGTYKDDIKYGEEDIHALDKKDPNFDPKDPNEGGWDLKASDWKPAAEQKAAFQVSVRNLRDFKKKVKSFTEEFINSNDVAEFEMCIKELDSVLFHQDIPAIVLKLSLDKTEEERKRIRSLLNALHHHEVVSTSQMTEGFRKVLNCLDDLIFDYPNAKVIVSEFLSHARVSGCLDSREAGEMEQNFEQLTNPAATAAFKAGKKRIEQNVVEYFSSEDLGDFTLSTKKLHGAIHFEVVKKLMSISLDRTDRQRELASKAIASLSGGTISQGEVEKGFTIMLGRVEDLALDVPEVLLYMTRFMARATADEAIPPAFLERVDLAAGDAGTKVLIEAKKMLAQPKACATLAGVWGWVEMED